MLNKKEIIENLRQFIKNQNRLLLFDIDGTSDIISLILKTLINDIKSPLKIAFLSTHQAHFSEVFGKSSTSIKVNTNYVLGGHKVNFHIYDKDMLKNPISDVDYLIIYPCENIKEKELVKLFSVNNLTNKVIFIIENSNDKFKHIKKLSPHIISLKENDTDKYWSAIKSAISNK